MTGAVVFGFVVSDAELGILIVTAGVILDAPAMFASPVLIPLPSLPFELDGRRPGLRLETPRLGEHTCEVLAGLGVGEAELERRGVLVADRGGTG